MLPNRSAPQRTTPQKITVNQRSPMDSRERIGCLCPYMLGVLWDKNSRGRPTLTARALELQIQVAAEKCHCPPLHLAVMSLPGLGPRLFVLSLYKSLRYVAGIISWAQLGPTLLASQEPRFAAVRDLQSSDESGPARHGPVWCPKRGLGFRV